MEDFVCANCHRPDDPDVETKQKFCRICQKVTTHWLADIDPMAPRRGVVTIPMWGGSNAQDSSRS